MEQATPIKRKVQQNMQNDAAGFAQMPQYNQSPEQPPISPEELQRPEQVPVPSGPSQGQSLAERAGKFFPKKEFFGQLDYKSTILVFFLVLIFSSSIIPGLLRPYSPTLVDPINGQATLLYAVAAAIIASLLFLGIKTAAGF